MIWATRKSSSPASAAAISLSTSTVPGRASEVQPAGEVHCGAEDVTHDREHRAVRESRPHIRAEFPAIRVGYPQRHASGGPRLVSDEKHLVAERLDQPAAVLGRDVRRRGLEALYKRRELNFVEFPADLGESHQIGKTDRHGNPAGNHVVVGGRDRKSARSRGCDMPPPFVPDQRLHPRHEQSGQVKRPV